MRKCVLLVRRSEQIQQGRKSGRWLKVEILAVKGPMVVISTGASIFSNKCKQMKKTSGQWICSHDRTGAPVLWLSWEGQIDVWERFSDNSYLSAILDKDFWMQLQLTLKSKNTESFPPQLLQGFWSKLKGKNPKIVVMSQTVTTKNSKQKEVIWQQYRLCLAGEEKSNPWW